VLGRRRLNPGESDNFMRITHNFSVDYARV
jgi:hypothetical protein